VGRAEAVHSVPGIFLSKLPKQWAALSWHSLRLMAERPSVPFLQKMALNI
jgi:hypothetical protein